jgi:N6-L-threonylcarbamoyladenine synthase
MVARAEIPVIIPPIKLCMDNGAMIAAAAARRFARGERSGWELDVVPSLRLESANWTQTNADERG